LLKELSVVIWREAMSKKITFCLLLPLLIAVACQHSSPPIQEAEPIVVAPPLPETSFLVVLGTAQDAGYPQANCSKSCCSSAWKNPAARKMVSCLGLVDPASGQKWMFDATPDFKFQLQLLDSFAGTPTPNSGIFLTHAHMGHYTGLMHLGREAMGARNIPVYTMPGMLNYLTNNGPWSQLVKLENIRLAPLQKDSTIALSEALSVTPLQVPHRDEFSETVGFKITGPNRTALFIPDIDKWNKWERDLISEIEQVDFAFIDGTFFQNGELPGRDMAEIPHPFVEETTQILANLPATEKSKVYFIHFNHTNPLLQNDSQEQTQLKESGFNIAQERAVFKL